MNIDDYHRIIIQNGYEEYPEIVTGSELFLEDFINYSQIELSLKKHLCKAIICRSFPPTGGVVFGNDLKWFQANFLKDYKSDLHKPWITTYIIEAINLINSNSLSKRLIGTSFMFPVIESYVKYYLGYRPDDYNFFDKRKKDYVKEHIQVKNSRDITLAQSIEILKSKQFTISNIINEIDDFSINFLSSRNIAENNWIIAHLSKRLTTIRNAMLHGEIHGFHEIGDYMIMIYALFHLYTIKE